MRKLLIVLWFLYFSATCNQAGVKPDLVFIKATSQDYSGGAAGSGQGTYYNFIFFIRRYDITFDSVWINGYVIPTTLLVTPNNDTIDVQAITYIRRKMGAQDRMPVSEPRKEETPVAVTGVAVLSYTSGKVVKYISVPAIKRLKPLNYP